MNIDEKFNPQIILQFIEGKQQIPNEMFLGMMNSENIEDQGMAFQIFDQYSSLIEKMPSQKDILDFYLHFFQRCMLENQDGEFVESCYMTAISFTAFYKKLCSDKSISTSQLKDFRDMLKNVYLNGDNNIRECVINGALEHLFESPSVISDFKDWQKDRRLNEAYVKALEFHGHSG